MSGFLEPKYKDIRDNSGFLHSNMYSKPFHPFFSHTELFPLPSPNLSIMLHTVHLKFFDSRKDEEIRILRLFRFLFLTEQRRFKLWVFQIIARANFLMSTTWGNKATEGERINKHFYTKKPSVINFINLKANTAITVWILVGLIGLKCFYVISLYP